MITWKEETPKSTEPKRVKKNSRSGKKKTVTKAKKEKNNSNAPTAPKRKRVDPTSTKTKGVMNNLCVPLTVGDEDNDEHDMDPKSQKTKGNNNPCGPVTVGDVDNDEHPIIIENQFLGTFDLNKFGSHDLQRV